METTTTKTRHPKNTIPNNQSKNVCPDKSLPSEEAVSVLGILDTNVVMLAVVVDNDL